MAKCFGVTGRWEVKSSVWTLVPGIWLLVGGIRIMNIMLASVLEQKPEIGLLRGIGAT